MATSNTAAMGPDAAFWDDIEEQPVPAPIDRTGWVPDDNLYSDDDDELPAATDSSGDDQEHEVPLNEQEDPSASQKGDDTPDSDLNSGLEDNLPVQGLVGHTQDSIAVDIAVSHEDEGTEFLEELYDAAQGQDLEGDEQDASLSEVVADSSAYDESMNLINYESDSDAGIEYDEPTGAQVHTAFTGTDQDQVSTRFSTRTQLALDLQHFADLSDWFENSSAAEQVQDDQSGVTEPVFVLKSKYERMKLPQFLKLLNISMDDNLQLSNKALSRDPEENRRHATKNGGWAWVRDSWDENTASSGSEKATVNRALNRYRPSPLGGRIEKMRLAWAPDTLGDCDPEFHFIYTFGGEGLAAVLLATTTDTLRLSTRVILEHMTGPRWWSWRAPTS